VGRASVGDHDAPPERAHLLGARAEPATGKPLIASALAPHPDLLRHATPVERIVALTRDPWEASQVTPGSKPPYREAFFGG
jgi:hypothetical protein